MHEVHEPRLVIGKIAVTVVHDNFVKVTDDGRMCALYHLIGLPEKCTHTLSDVVVEDAVQSIIVCLLFAPVNKPKIWWIRMVGIE